MILPRSLLAALAPVLGTLGITKAIGNGAAASGESTALLWGPYRPNLYFGVRPQIPNTLLMGLMWSSGENRDAMVRSTTARYISPTEDVADTRKDLRDTCEQGDKMPRYGWTMYDTRVGGVQMIHDEENSIDLKTEFIKAADGGSWGVRVTGVPAPDAPSDGVKTTIVFHVALEDLPEDGSNPASKSLVCAKGDAFEAGRRVAAVCHGKDPALGDFNIRVLESQQAQVQESTVTSLRVNEDRIWKAKGEGRSSSST